MVVLFVCMGNICRSPTAHGVFRERVREAELAPWVSVRSAGTHDYHAGAPPDPRSQAHAARRGYDLSDLRASVLRRSDLEIADLVLVMDDDNLAQVRSICPPQHRHKLQKLARFGRLNPAGTVPDPYAGGPGGFERVLDLVEDACDGLLDHVRRELASRRAATPADAPGSRRG